MSEIMIAKQDVPRHGRYVARVAGIDAEAELVYTHRGAGLISAEWLLPGTCIRSVNVRISA